MFCPNCGKQNSDDSLFCAECGTPFPKVPAPGKENSASVNDGRSESTQNSSYGQQTGGYGQQANGYGQQNNGYGQQTGGYNPNNGYAGGNGGYNPNNGYAGGNGGYNPNNGYAGGNSGYNPNKGYAPKNDTAAGNNNDRGGYAAGTGKNEKDKKDSGGKMPVIIICVICAIIMVGVVIFAATKLMGGKKNDIAEVETSTEAQIKETTKEETTEAETTEEETEEETTTEAETTKVDPKVSGYGTWIVNCASNDSVTLRTRPDITEDAEHLLKIQGQVKVKVLDVDCEGFFKVSVGGEEGYILGSYLDPTDDSIDLESTQTLTATEGDIHLLDLPHVSGSSVIYRATINQGDKVTYYATTLSDQEGKTYYFVEYNGVRGYVVTSYQGRKLFE